MEIGQCYAKNQLLHFLVESITFLAVRIVVV